MKSFTRRKFLLVSATLPIVSCAATSRIIKPIKTIEQIKAEVATSINIMRSEIPGSVDLEKESHGMLIIPNISEANFWLGGAYGEGSLRCTAIRPRSVLVLRDIMALYAMRSSCQGPFPPPTAAPMR